MTVAQKHIPLRRCRTCRMSRPKSELTRWVIIEGQLVLDTAQARPGRGIYSCSDVCAVKLPKLIKGFKR